MKDGLLSRLKFPVWLVLGSAGLIPLGNAFAERADVAAQAAYQVPAPVRELVGQGKLVLDSLHTAGRQLDSSIRLAQKNEDSLLLTCLTAKRDEMNRLRLKAVARFDAIGVSANVESARLPYVALTVIAEKANLVSEEAARCVGGDQRESGFSVAAIEPPTDPYLYVPADEAAFSPKGDLSILVPPPLSPGTSDMPGDMPSMPDVASPTR